MSSGVQFPAALVLRHGAAVSDASEQMAQARAVVREVTIDSGAYGQLCQFLPGILSALFGNAAEAINDAVDALGETVLKLRATATDMTATDAGSARRLDSAAGPGLALPL